MERFFQAVHLSAVRLLEWYKGMPPHHRVFFAVKLLFCAGAIWWLRFVPTPGKAGIIIAVVAAFMSLQTDMRPWQKAAWFLLIAAFVAVEFKSIDKEKLGHDREQAAARAQQTRNFSEIANGIEQTIQESQRQSNERQQEFNATMNSMKGLWSQTTGGNSYIYFDISFVGGPIEIEIPGVHKGEMVSNCFPKFVGSYPLHNVFVAVFGPGGWRPSIDYGNIFPKEIGRPRQGIELTFLPDKPKRRFNLWINTSNGSYSQDILFLKVGDKWLWASHFYKYGLKKPIRVWAVPGFPKEQLNADWYKD